jgi:phospholipase D1/2
VKIFVICWKEFEALMNNDSSYTKRYLESLSENINVVRHPTHIMVMWSHHEKSVVIDQKIGFMGGVDLCFGRWDDEEYRLFEAGGVGGQGMKGGTYFPGADYVNMTIKDSDLARLHEKCMIDPMNDPRLPWRDVHVRLEGQVVYDLARNFSQYWNFVKNEAESKGKKQFLF